MPNNNPQRIIDQIQRALEAANLQISFPALALGHSSIAMPIFNPRPFLEWGQAHPDLDVDAPETWPEGVEAPSIGITDSLQIPLYFGTEDNYVNASVGVAFASLMSDPNVVEKVTTSVYQMYEQWENSSDDEPAAPSPTLKLTGADAPADAPQEDQEDAPDEAPEAGSEDPDP